MKNKNPEMNQAEGKKAILKIIQGTINEIIIIGRGEGEDINDYNKITVNIASLADNWGQKILHKLYQILQNEVDYISSFRGLNDRFSCLSNLLYQQFHNELIENKDLEKIIEEKIKNLEENTFNHSGRHTIKQQYWSSIHSLISKRHNRIKSYSEKNIPSK